MPKYTPYDARDIRDMLVQYIADNKDLPLWFIKNKSLIDQSGEKITFGQLDTAFREERVSHLDNVLVHDIAILDTRDFLLATGLAEINENSQRRGIKLAEHFFANEAKESLRDTFEKEAAQESKKHFSRTKSFLYASTGMAPLKTAIGYRRAYVRMYDNKPS